MRSGIIVKLGLAASLFDSLATYHHDELVAATPAIHGAAARLQSRKNPQAWQPLAEARKYAFSVPVSSEQVMDQEFFRHYSARKRDALEAR